MRALPLKTLHFQPCNSSNHNNPRDPFGSYLTSIHCLALRQLLILPKDFLEPGPFIVTLTCYFLGSVLPQPCSTPISQRLPAFSLHFSLKLSFNIKSRINLSIPTQRPYLHWQTRPPVSVFPFYPQLLFLQQTHWFIQDQMLFLIKKKKKKPSTLSSNAHRPKVR